MDLPIIKDISHSIDYGGFRKEDDPPREVCCFCHSQPPADGYWVYRVRADAPFPMVVVCKECTSSYDIHTLSNILKAVLAYGERIQTMDMCYTKIKVPRSSGDVTTGYLNSLGISDKGILVFEAFMEGGYSKSIPLPEMFSRGSSLPIKNPDDLDENYNLISDLVERYIYQNPYLSESVRDRIKDIMKK